MNAVLRHIKERFGQGPSKAKLQKEFFLMEQKKTESINQFAGRVEQQFKRLRALYLGRYDRSQLSYLELDLVLDFAKSRTARLLTSDA